MKQGLLSNGVVVVVVAHVVTVIVFREHLVTVVSQVRMVLLVLRYGLLRIISTKSQKTQITKLV